MLCSKCQFDNPEMMRFCGQCGAPLASEPVSGVRESAPDNHGNPKDAERRQMSLMFIDVVNYTGMSERLDPEVVRDIMLQFQKQAASVVHRYEGHVAKYLGDGVLVYFGYPKAHENDPQRAVFAGLEIVDVAKVLGHQFKRTHDVDFAIRIGIHTGLVIAGQMGSTTSPEHLAVVGSAANIAARIQAIAEPGTVVISGSTLKLTGEFISATSLGAHILKGVSEPMEVFRVEKTENLRSRSEWTVAHKQAPLVNRDNELQMLLDGWSQAKQSRGQVLLLSGEAGIGKSRLTQALISHLSGQDYECLIGYGSPFRQNSAFSPFIDLMQEHFKFTAQMTAESRLQCIATEAETLGQELAVPLLASLLSLPTQNLEPLNLSPQEYRARLLELLTSWLLQIAARKPLLLIIEDLHWIDPSSVDLLKHLIDRSASASILMVITTRKGQSNNKLATHRGIRSATLGPLDEDYSRAMVKTVADKQSLPTAVTAQIITKADGNPLYIEEVTKVVLESERLAVPLSLQDSLTERLDTLGSGKQIAQIGAVIGRQFDHDLIIAVAGIPEDKLNSGLDRLVDSELLQVKEVDGTSLYTFKHALIQDAAYESLLKTRRQELHRRVAEQFEAPRYEELRNTQPELLAHHYTEAGLNETAIKYLQQAGARALSRSAGQEAISHFTKALELVGMLPTGPQRQKLELDLQIALGGPTTAVHGYADSGVERIYLRARELAEALNDHEKIYQVLAGLYRCYVTRAQFDRAREAGEAMLKLAHERADESGYLLEAERAIGCILLTRGDLQDAIDHLENGIRIYKPEEHHKHIIHFASDPGLTCYLWSVVTLWLMGHPQQALDRSLYAMNLAKELGHTFTYGFATNFAAWVRIFCRDWDGAFEQAKNAVDICSKRRFLLWLSTANVFYGRTLVKRGDPELGISKMREGISGFRTTGAQISLPQLLSQLAESYLELDRLDEGLAVLGDAMETVEANNERFWEAELHRLQGDFLRADNRSVEEVLACYQRGVDVARSQGARALELRALTSAVGLLGDDDGRAKAIREQLESVYNWFQEGREHADLRNAAKLLAS